MRSIRQPYPNDSPRDRASSVDSRPVLSSSTSSIPRRPLCASAAYCANSFTSLGGPSRLRVPDSRIYHILHPPSRARSAHRRTTPISPSPRRRVAAPRRRSSPIVSRHHISRQRRARALSAFPTIEPVSAFSARARRTRSRALAGSESVQRYGRQSSRAPPRSDASRNVLTQSSSSTLSRGHAAARAAPAAGARRAVTSRRSPGPPLRVSNPPRDEPVRESRSRARRRTGG